MPLPTLAEQYTKKGYILLEHLLPVADALRARQQLEDAFAFRLWEEAPYSTPHLINDIYSYYPELLTLLITPALINAVAAITGRPVVWLPECSAHRNRYIGWHKDTSIQEQGGLNSHWEQATPLIQCAIYFQQNSVETGGGLTLIPGSHGQGDAFSPMLTGRRHLRAWYKLQKLLGLSAFNKADRHPALLNLLTQPGDVLLFDVRIDHRSTKPGNPAAAAPDKLAIFNTFGPANKATEDYFRFMKQRPEPYYQYYREVPLPQIVYDHARQLGVEVWY